MAKLIDVPGMGQVEFPDDMPDSQIEGILAKQAPKQPTLASEVPKVLDTGIRGAITGLPGLLADTVTL
jgi:hypothetical protein